MGFDLHALLTSEKPVVCREDVSGGGPPESLGGSTSGAVPWPEDAM